MSKSIKILIVQIVYLSSTYSSNYQAPIDYNGDVTIAGYVYQAQPAYTVTYFHDYNPYAEDIDSFAEKFEKPSFISQTDSVQYIDVGYDRTASVLPSLYGVASRKPTIRYTNVDFASLAKDGPSAVLEFPASYTASSRKPSSKSQLKSVRYTSVDYSPRADNEKPTAQAFPATYTATSRKPSIRYTNVDYGSLAKDGPSGALEFPASYGVTSGRPSFKSQAKSVQYIDSAYNSRTNYRTPAASVFPSSYFGSGPISLFMPEADQILCSY